MTILDRQNMEAVLAEQTPSTSPWSHRSRAQHPFRRGFAKRRWGASAATPFGVQWDDPVYRGGGQRPDRQTRHQDYRREGRQGERLHTDSGLKDPLRSVAPLAKRAAGMGGSSRRRLRQGLSLWKRGSIHNHYRLQRIFEVHPPTPMP